jgi:hypothetical protein
MRTHIFECELQFAFTVARFDPFDPVYQQRALFDADSAYVEVSSRTSKEVRAIAHARLAREYLS